VACVPQLKPENVSLLTELVAKYEPSVLCLQEHKLQEKDVPPIEKQLAELLPSYTAHWTCSTEKKGYSGLVVLTRGAWVAVGGGGASYTLLTRGVWLGERAVL